MQNRGFFPENFFSQDRCRCLAAISSVWAKYPGTVNGDFLLMAGNKWNAADHSVSMQPSVTQMQRLFPPLKCWLNNYWLCPCMLKLDSLQVRRTEKLLMCRILENWGRMWSNPLPLFWGRIVYIHRLSLMFVQLFISILQKRRSLCLLRYLVLTS